MKNTGISKSSGQSHSIQKDRYVLRTSDILEMVKDGTIDQQHFLIRLIAETLTQEGRE